MINRAAIEKIHSYTKIGQDEGARLLTGGEIATDGDLGKGFFYRPTVFGDVDAQMRIAQEEIFGPTTALIKVARLRRGDPRRERDQVRPLVRRSSRATSTRRSARCATSQTGITYINAGTTGAEVHLPFGGTKDTGNGHREAGQAALDVFTEWKSIYVDYSGQAPARPDRQRPVALRVPGNVSDSTLHKLVWFVPREALEATRDAVFAAGAGRIGRVPALLLVHGRDRDVPSRRGRRSVDRPRWGGRSASRSCASRPLSRGDRADEVVDALREAHPYEEVAFELYPLVELAP